MPTVSVPGVFVSSVSGVQSSSETAAARRSESSSESSSSRRSRRTRRAREARQTGSCDADLRHVGDLMLGRRGCGMILSRMSEWTAEQIPDQAGRIGGRHRRQQRPRAGDGARAGPRRGDGRRDRARPRRPRRARRRSPHAAGRRARACGCWISPTSSRSASSPAEVRRPPEARPAGQQRRRDDAAARETADGFELQFGTNHLGHFALTGLLLDALSARRRTPRVVTVSSLEHRPGQDRLRRSRLRAQLLAARRLSALEVRQRRLRPRARPPPARGRLAGDQRARPPGLLRHEPAEHRADRTDEGACLRSAIGSSPRAPSRARCRSSTRRPPPMSRAASSSAPTAFSSCAARPRGPAGRPRSRR